MYFSRVTKNRNLCNLKSNSSKWINVVCTFNPRKLMQIWKRYYATGSDCLCKIQIKHIMMDAMAKSMERKGKETSRTRRTRGETPGKKYPRAVFPQNQKTWIFY